MVGLGEATKKKVKGFLQRGVTPPVCVGTAINSSINLIKFYRARVIFFTVMTVTKFVDGAGSIWFVTRVDIFEFSKTLITRN